MILMVFDPRVGKRIAVEVADAPKPEPIARTVPSRPRGSGDGPEDGQQRQHDRGQDQHEAEHAATAEMLPRKTLQDHGAPDRLGE